LQERFAEMSKREIYAAWVVDFERIKPEVDVLTEELRTTYAAFVAKLVPTLSRAVQINAEVSRLNQTNLWDRHFTCQRPQLFYFRLTPYAMFRLFHR
jgi:hypothetical protein